jgi:hypothetical protein
LYVLLGKWEEECSHRQAQAKIENLSKNCSKVKKPGGVAEMLSACLALTRVCIQTPVHPKVLIVVTTLKKYTTTMKQVNKGLFCMIHFIQNIHKDKFI